MEEPGCPKCIHPLKMLWALYANLVKTLTPLRLEGLDLGGNGVT